MPINPDILPFVTGEPCSSDFEQFIEYGQYEGRLASNFYNEQIYLADNPDVAAAVNGASSPMDSSTGWNTGNSKAARRSDRP